jgi:hypothetical protein
VLEMVYEDEEGGEATDAVEPCCGSAGARGREFRNGCMMEERGLQDSDYAAVGDSVEESVAVGLFLTG